MSGALSSQAQVFNQSTKSFREASLNLKRAETLVGTAINGFIVGMAGPVADVVNGLLGRIRAPDLTGLGQRVGFELAKAARFFAGIFVLPNTALAAIQNGLSYVFAQCGNVLLAVLKTVAIFFQDGLLSGMQALGASIMSVLMKAFDGPLRSFQAGIEAAMQAANPEQYRDPVQEARLQAKVNRNREIYQHPERRNVVEAAADLARMGGRDDKKNLADSLQALGDYQKIPKRESVDEIYNRNKGQATRFGLYDGGKTADEWQKQSREGLQEAFQKAGAAMRGFKVEDVLGAGQYGAAASTSFETVARAGQKAVQAAFPPALATHDADAEVASTNKRPATLPHAPGSETLPPAPGPETRPNLLLARPLSTAPRK